MGVVEAGREGCLSGAVAVTSRKQLEAMPGEERAGQMNTQPSLSSSLNSFGHFALVEPNWQSEGNRECS